MPVTIFPDLGKAQTICSGVKLVFLGPNPPLYTVKDKKNKVRHTVKLNLKCNQLLGFELRMPATSITETFVTYVICFIALNKKVFRCKQNTEIIEC